MPIDHSSSRRKFIQQLSGSAMLLASGPLASLAQQEKFEERIIEYQKRIGPNDKIRIAVIGTGIMGHNDLQTALKVPGVELAAACDLYSGRLERIKEQYGKQIFTTSNFHEILDKKDIDAV